MLLKQRWIILNLDETTTIPFASNSRRYWPKSAKFEWFFVAEAFNAAVPAIALSTKFWLDFYPSCYPAGGRFKSFLSTNVNDPNAGRRCCSVQSFTNGPQPKEPSLWRSPCCSASYTFTSGTHINFFCFYFSFWVFLIFQRIPQHVPPVNIPILPPHQKVRKFLNP